ncbi:MAG: WD40 repeat domain-containing protein [Planctomycetes bacterium]|nr:WD40 repeat domain-containing protein [Planctomycetota bacterium]
MCRQQGICAALALAFVAVPATAGPKDPRRSEPPLPPGARVRLGLSGPRHEGAVGAVARSPDGVASLAFSPDGKTLVAGGTSGLVRAWDARTGKEQRRLAAHADSVDALSFSPDGRTLATGGRDRRVVLWDPATGRERVRLAGPSPRVNCLSFTPDGQTLAAGGGIDGQAEPISLWQVATGKQLGELRGHRSGTLSLVFLPDGRLASSGGDRTVSLHLPLGNEGSIQLEGPVASDARLALTADARSLVSADMSGTVCIWELLTRKIRFRVADPADTHYAVAVSPEGRLAAVGGWAKTVTVFDLATGATIARFRGHQDAIHALVFAPDGRTVASGGPDGTVFLWDVAPPPERPVPVNAKQMEALWGDLGGEDAGKAYRAVWRLALSGEASVPFLRDRLAAPDGRLVARKIADLDHTRFKVREAAQAQLEQWGEEVLPALERTLAARPTLEVRRRLEGILARLRELTPTGPQLARVRAIEVFGKVRDGQALPVLAALAKDKQGTRLEAAELRQLASELHDRLEAAADALERLTDKGWESMLTLYDVTFCHPYIYTEADAREKIADLGLDPEDFSYLEYEDEEGEEDEEDFEDA